MQNGWSISKRLSNRKIKPWLTPKIDTENIEISESTLQFAKES